MVSLTRSYNTNSGGATFFSDSTNMGDTEHLQPILDSCGTFKPLKTIYFFALHTIFTISLEVLTVIYTLNHPKDNQCREYFIVLYAHAGLWFLTFIIDLIVRHYHYKLRIYGYLEFYYETYILHRLPFYVVSLWGATIMIIQTLMQHLYSDDFINKCIENASSNPMTYLCMLITLEVVVIFINNIKYIRKVWQYNYITMPPPDVQREDWAACSTESLGRTEVGCTPVGDKLMDLLKKQAELIRFLKEHNARLSEKVMVLSAQNQARRRQEVPTQSEP